MKSKSKLRLPRIIMGSDEFLNQSLQGDLEKISYMSSNGPPGNCCKVPSEHVIGHVLEGQNEGSTVGSTKSDALSIGPTRPSNKSSTTITSSENSKAGAV